MWISVWGCALRLFLMGYHYEGSKFYSILKREYLKRGITMGNPWKDISLSDYENHMSLDSVKQLQSMNQTMKHQLNDYDVSTLMILGITGGNDLEHVNTEKHCIVYGVDNNDSYLRKVEKRYPDLKGILHCINIDLISEYEKLPESQLLIANLLIEYIGYEAFNRVVIQTRAKYVSCVIQINSSEKEWVSDSPYIHVFDGLDRIYCRMEEIKLSEAMNSIGYQKILQTSDLLPNGKSLVRLDYQRTE